MTKDLEYWTRELEVEGARLRREMLAGDDRVEAMLAGALRRLQAPAATERRHWSTDEALVLIRSLLVPFCGPGMAKATIDFALQRSSAGHVLRVADWKLFVRHLSEAIESICGSAAGALVGTAGLSLAVSDQERA